MKHWLFYFSFLVGVQGWAQTDTLYEENLRKVADIVFGDLQSTIYGQSLINRSFTTSQITLNQIDGNYDYVHSISDFFSLYQDAALSYLDSTKLMNNEELVNFITNEFEQNELTNEQDELIQPFGFMLHNISCLDSSFIDSIHFVRNNYSITPIVSEETLYTTKQFKSASLLEFYPESGYLSGKLKYVPELISTSTDISNLSMMINVGSGFQPFNAVENLIKYNRASDSLIGKVSFYYEINETKHNDTIAFYLTTKGEKSESNWDFIAEFENSTTIKFDVGVKMGCGNTTNYCRRPIIIIPPYRPSTQLVSMKKYFEQFNVSGMFNELSDLGYDIFFIKLKPGNKSLELAAQALSEYITMINQNKEDGFPNESWENIIIGYSMGGQIARYALKKMEKDHMESGAPHHHTRLYIPFDSPHLGANIPMFTQCVYKDQRFSNIFAMLSYNSLVDEASRDMGASHIEGSLINIEDNGAGEPKIYHILPGITGERRDFLLDLYDYLNHQFTAPVGDMRRGFPAFTRNISISTGANDQDYNQLYNLEPGKLLFHQSAIGAGYGGFYYKLRRLYSSKWQYDHTVFRNKEQILQFLIPITTKNRDYRVIYGDEFDLAQGGYKDEFYDKLAIGFVPTGAVSILRTSAFGFGQKEYNNHMCFLPMVSALAINKDIWGLGNLQYNLKDEGLMYNFFNYNPNTDKSDIFGYPNLGHPSDHFSITPFEAIYCDPFTYEHIKMKESQTENDYNADYLDYLTDFIVNEVESESVFLQNKVIGNNHVQWDPSFTYKAWYKAQNILTIGNLVTPKTDPGDYVIEATGNITVYAGQEINLKPGFHSQQGSEFHAYIDYACYPDGGKSQQNTQNDSKVSKEVINKEYDVSQSLQKTEYERVEISIFPNPSKAEVTVLFPVNLEGNFEIVNSIGAIIQQNTVPSDYKSILKLESGIYFIHYQSNLGHKLTKQIIIL